MQFYATIADGVYTFPVPMRTEPSIYCVANGLRVLCNTDATTTLNGNAMHLDSSRVSKRAARFQITSGVSETAGDSAWVELNNNGAKIGLDAEL